MTKSRPSLRNSARHGLELILSALLVCGCSTPSAPTYKKRDIEKTFQKILKQEYKTDSRARLVGQTLWIYIPLEDLFERLEQPQKVKEKFEIQENTSSLETGVFKLSYLVKPVPEQEKLQEYGFNKKTMKKVYDAWEALRRIIFSMDRDERNQILFYVMIAADIKNGIEMSETVYYRDMVKMIYRLISVEEYQHRMIFDTAVSSQIVRDRLGMHVDYKDIDMVDFLCAQMQNRISMKFQKAEHTIDVDREVSQIFIETLKIYEFDNFRKGELFNLLTNKKTVIPQKAVRHPEKG